MCLNPFNRINGYIADFVRENAEETRLEEIKMLNIRGLLQHS